MVFIWGILAIALLVLPAGFLTVCYRMRQAKISQPPGIPFFFLFGAVGGALLLSFLPLSFLTVLTVLFLLGAILVALYFSIWLAVLPEKSAYHRVAMWGCFAMPILLPATYVAAHLLVWGPYEPTNRESLEKEFAYEFGIAPPPAITNIQCKIAVVGDTWEKWMRFTLDESTVQAIVRKGVTEATSADLGRSSGELWHRDLTHGQGVNAPAWWRSPPHKAQAGGKPTRIYYKVGHRTDFGGSYMYLWIDDEGQMVYSKSSAWD